MKYATRSDIRNVAIIAHVDHGKTTLVDAMLKQSKVFRENQEVGSLILDSNPLEREKGITILAKNTAVAYGSVKVNLIDTPGHADFSGEVERVLNMADGCLLLVDAVDGPMPQTRFVLSKALALGLKPVVVINKIDRPYARVAQVLEEIQDLFLELATESHQLDFEVVYTNARDGQASRDPAQLGENLEPLFDAIVRTIPAPEVDLDGAFQMLVTNINYDDYRGRSAIGRILRGTTRAGDLLVHIDGDGLVWQHRASQIFAFEGLKRVPLEEARAGDIVLITGLEGVSIGDTVASVDSPEALPRLEIEQPTVKMSLGVNSSPFSGQEGKYCMSRQILARLTKELETNIALRVEETGSADEFLVSGRGELHLAILVETLRREGYEFEISRPEVITHEENDHILEPIEELVIDTSEQYVGALSEQLARRLGQMTGLHNDGSGHVRLEYRIPTRGLIGFRYTFLTITHGDGIMGSVMVGYEPWRGEMVSLRAGVLVASNTGVAVSYGLANAQERGFTFVEPGERVYEGMIVGWTRYPIDIPVNVCKEKKQTNIRASTADIAVRLTPATKLSLEECIDFLNQDELLEVTPKTLRLRKKLLKADERNRARKLANAG
ncbi:MAG: translational GTPase TypA [Chloroflexota bacterium]|nr:MAG: translational GTPase TypA [Chloroflexota bacterium]